MVEALQNATKNESNKKQVNNWFTCIYYWNFLRMNTFICRNNSTITNADGKGKLNELSLFASWTSTKNSVCHQIGNCSISSISMTFWAGISFANSESKQNHYYLGLLLLIGSCRIMLESNHIPVDCQASQISAIDWLIDQMSASYKMIMSGLQTLYLPCL